MRCAPPPASSGLKCVDACKTKDSILATARKNEFGERMVDYNRFCVLECRPKCGAKAPASKDPGYMHRCEVLKPTQVQGAKVLDGNGKELPPRDCLDDVDVSVVGMFR